jgi:hypothetical protein
MDSGFSHVGIRRLSVLYHRASRSRRCRSSGQKTDGIEIGRVTGDELNPDADAGIPAPLRGGGDAGGGR